LDTTDKAADTDMIFGMDKAAAEGWINTLTAGDTIRLDGKTYEEVKDDILSGTAANTILFGGKTYAEVVNEIGDTVDGASIQFRIPAMRDLLDESDLEVSPPEHWIKIGQFSGAIDDQTADVTLLLTGGRDDSGLSDETHQTILLQIGATYDYTDGAPPFAMQLKQALIKELTPGTKPIQLGYRTVGSEGTAAVEVWLKGEGNYNPITVTELTFKRFNAATFATYTYVSELTVVEPAGLIYPDRYLEGTAEIEQLLAHEANTSNPHAVTKAQVGLGNVANNPSASDAEAITGTATNRFMTPASTQAKVDDSIGVLCTELIEVMDDALANLFV